MKEVLRLVAAIVAGMVVSFALVVGVEFFSAVVHPFPEDFGGTNDEVCRHVERYPAWVLAMVVPAWGVVALAGVGTAARIGNLISSVTVGVLLLAALGFNLAMLPYPTWFKLANLLALPCAMLLGARHCARRAPRNVAPD